MITDPRFAPKRADLPWLRRRRVPPAATAAPAQPPRAAAAPAQQPQSAVGDFLAGRATHRRPQAQPETPSPAPASPPPAPPSRQPAAAPASSLLDLDAPAAPPARPAAPASSSLDLDAPAAPPARPAAPTSSSLDLDPTPTQSSRARPTRPNAPVRRRPTAHRVLGAARSIFTVADPTVTLTRLQSAIGTLSFEAAVSREVGDLRIGAAYELASGPTSTVQLTQGNRFGPPRSRRPVLVAAHERFETIGVDLRQCAELRRLIIYAFSEARRPLQWGGTLITTTFGGARLELPLETLQSGDSAVLLSLYNVDGEFVLRAEMQTLFGDVRECCRTYGFDRITWLDDRTPVE